MIGIDSRETAPLKATQDMYNHNPLLAREGGLSIAVPGEIAGYWRAHQLAGRLPWKKLFEPTIEYCRNGIRVSAMLEKIIHDTEKQIKNDYYLNKTLIKSNGERLKENDKFKMLELARTLEIIGEQGADAFYNGTLSETIVNEIAARGMFEFLFNIQRHS